MLEVFKIFGLKLLEHYGSLGGDGGKKNEQIYDKRSRFSWEEATVKKLRLPEHSSFGDESGSVFLLSHKEEPVALVACEGTARQDTPL